MQRLGSPTASQIIVSQYSSSIDGSVVGRDSKIGLRLLELLPSLRPRVCRQKRMNILQLKAQEECSCGILVRYYIPSVVTP